MGDPSAEGYSDILRWFPSCVSQMDGLIDATERVQLTAQFFYVQKMVDFFRQMFSYQLGDEYESVDCDGTQFGVFEA